MVKKHAPIILYYIFLICVYWRWIYFSIVRYGDWFFYFYQTSSEFSELNSWNSNKLLGQFDLSLWKFPFLYLYGIISSLGFNSNIVDKILIFWPIIFLLPFFGYIFLHIKLKFSSLSSTIGVMILTLNTYLLAVNSQGHEFFILAWIFSIPTFYYFKDFLEDIKFNKLLLSIIFLFLTGILELRILYLSIVILAIYTLFDFILVKKNKNIYSYFKVLILFIPAGLIFFLLNLFWILPSIKSNVLSNNQYLERSLFGDEYLNILYPLTLLHPFWSGEKPTWFIRSPIQLQGFIFPLLAFLGSIYNKKNNTIIFFTIITLLGILLSKQISSPFPDLYIYLFDHLPGFKMFREATKFYYFIVLGYSVLITAFFDLLIKIKLNRGLNILKKVFIVFFISIICINAIPILTGKIENLYVLRTIPSDYLKFKDFILSQNDFSRTLWIPKDSNWGYFDNKHPKLMLLTVDETEYNHFLDPKYNSVTEFQKKIVSILDRPYSKNIVNNASIKYIVIPIKDTANDDNFYSTLTVNRQELIRTLNQVSFLKKIDIGTKELVIYENKGYKPHIYQTQEDESIDRYISYKKVEFTRINSSEYKIKLRKISGRTYLNFSDAFHPQWKIKIGEFKWYQSVLSDNYFSNEKLHYKNVAFLNSFVIDSSYIKKYYPKTDYKVNSDGSVDIDLTLYFKPQSYYYIGLIISGLTLIMSVTYLITHTYRYRHGRT